MDDTIRRQTILDALDEISREVDDGYGFDYEKWRKYFCELPTAKLATDTNVGTKLGTNLAQLGTDLISRQAAIDAIDVLCQEHRYKIPGKGETYSQYNEAWQDALDRAEGAIFNLPPAEPETAKRIVGKSRDGMTLWYQCDMCNEPVDAQDNFCRGCGRRLTDG